MPTLVLFVLIVFGVLFDSSFGSAGFGVSDDRPIEFDVNYCSFLNSLALSPGYSFNNDKNLQVQWLKSGSGGAHNRKEEEDALEASKAYLVKALQSIPRDVWFSYFSLTPDQWNFTLSSISSTPCAVNASSSAFAFQPYIPQSEGEIAAPLSHKIVFTNEQVKVIDWNLYANYRENYHTHGLASIMLLLIRSARAYYDWNSGRVPANINPTPIDPNNPGPIMISFMTPEFLHSIENLQDHTYHVMRVLFVPVNAQKTDYHWPASDILG